MYWVLFVVLLDIRQGLIVLKSSLFSIIWQFLGHGGWKFLFGGSCGGGGMWGWWHSVGGCDPKAGVSWQLCQCKIPKFTYILISMLKRQITPKKSKKSMSIFPSIQYNNYRVWVFTLKGAIWLDVAESWPLKTRRLHMYKRRRQADVTW